MSASGLDAVVLTSRAGFSWLSGGKLNYVCGATEQGVASLIVTREQVLCLTNNIERPRIEQEELAEAGIDLLEHPWQDGQAGTQLIDELIGKLRVGYDIPVPGLPAGAKSFTFTFTLAFAQELTRLRWALLPEEIERYKIAGKAASVAMEATIGQIKPGMSEHDIAGIAARNVSAQNARAWVILVAVDDRIEKYRHPIPTETKLRRIAMVVLCVEKFGLVCSLTRLISFGGIDDELRRKHNAVVNIDAAVNLSSVPGKTLGEMFELIRQSYVEAGFPDQWRLHHQGGPAGYQPRDCLAVPGDTTVLVENQALAWNPSITGTKSEDTIIITDADPIVVTAAGDDWPMIQCQHAGRTFGRPDILIV